MAYTILPAPAGTLGYKPKAPTLTEEILAPAAQNFGSEFGKGLKKGINQSIYKEAAQKEGLIPEYKIGADGETTITYGTPKEKKGVSYTETKEKMRAFLAGLGSPEEFGYTSQEEMDKAREDAKNKINADGYLRKYFGTPEPEKPDKEPSPSVVKGKLEMMLAGIGKPEDYGFTSQEEMDQSVNSLREEVKASEHLRKYFGITEPKSETDKESFDLDARKAMAGEMTFDDLAKKWPTKDQEKIQNMKATYEAEQAGKAPVEKNPKFKEAGQGFINRVKAAISPDMARLDPSTKKVIENIKTVKDLNELADQAAEYAKAGVDVKAIMEYFGRK